MSNELKALMSLVKGTSEFFEEENNVINTLLRGMAAREVPDGFKQKLKELIDMMSLMGNVFVVNKDHIDSLYSELSGEVRNGN